VLAVVALLAAFAALATVKSWVTGDAKADLRLLLIAGSETQPSRAAIARFATAEAFATYLLAYSLFALFLGRFSALGLAGAELVWLLPLELAPDVLCVPESRRREAAPASVAPPRLWPSQDIVLTVMLAEGQTVDLRPESGGGDGTSVGRRSPDRCSVREREIAGTASAHNLARLLAPLQRVVGEPDGKRVGQRSGNWKH
jgi:hypothetical protein